MSTVPATVETAASATSSRFLEGWRVVFASGVIMALTVGTFVYGFGAIFTPIIKEFGWSYAVTSVAFALRSEVGGIAGPFVGHFLDRAGSRVMMLGGVLIVVAGYLWMAAVHDLWSFYGATIVIAIGMSSAAGNVGTVAVSRWFVKRRARALAVMFAFSGIGGLTVGPMVWAVDAFGWRMTLVYVALIIAVIGFPLALLVRDSPEKYGLLPDGEPLAAGVTAAQTTAARRQATGPSITVRQALRMRTFWLLALASTASNLGAMAALVHMVPYLTSISISPALAAAAVTGISLISVGARLITGWIADARDKRQVLAIAIALQALGILAAALVSSPWMLVPLAASFGIGWGAPIPVRPAMMADSFGVEALGTINGLMGTITTVSSMIGPVLAGWVFDVTGSYRPAFFGLALFTLLAVPVILALPSKKDMAAGISLPTARTAS
ncbi:MAG: MFS transporter [Chloroflexi bacterium]|nr:MFS transporter [Chloroflexota bacterium]